MTISAPDFGQLTAVQFAIIALAVAAVDWVSGVLGALRTMRFSVSEVLTVLESHVVMRVLPIAGLFLMGQVGGVDALTKAADGALALYFLETAGSVQSNLH